MLTCLATVGGFLLVLGIGGAVVECPPVKRWLRGLEHRLPMFWDW